jgi:hypothetical protein
MRKLLLTLAALLAVQAGSAAVVTLPAFADGDQHDPCCQERPSGR